MAKTEEGLTCGGDHRGERPQEQNNYAEAVHLVVMGVENIASSIPGEWYFPFRDLRVDEFPEAQVVQTRRW